MSEHRQKLQVLANEFRQIAVLNSVQRTAREVSTWGPQERETYAMQLEATRRRIAREAAQTPTSGSSRGNALKLQLEQLTATLKVVRTC